MYTTTQKIDLILDVFNSYPRLAVNDFADQAGGNTEEAIHLANVMVFINLLSQTGTSTYQLTEQGSEVIALGGWGQFCKLDRHVSHTGGLKINAQSIVYSLREVKCLLLTAGSLAWIRQLLGS